MNTAVAFEHRQALFAANRARGRIALRAAHRGGKTRRTHVHEDGSLRVRFPNVSLDGALEAVIVNTAGGMAGGDQFSVGVALDRDAKLVVGTAAAEKIYGAGVADVDTKIELKLTVDDSASLAWLPQETILFDGARVSRQVDIELAAGASLLFCEAVVFGRAAMGEAVEAGTFTDRWRLSRGGKLVFAETMRLQDNIAGKLARPAVANGAGALATMLIVPGDETVCEAVRALAFAGEVGVSAWNGFAIVRFCARDGAALRQDIIGVAAALKRGALPRLWLG